MVYFAVLDKKKSYKNRTHFTKLTFATWRETCPFPYSVPMASIKYVPDGNPEKSYINE